MGKKPSFQPLVVTILPIYFYQDNPFPMKNSLYPFVFILGLTLFITSIKAQKSSTPISESLPFSTEPCLMPDKRLEIKNRLKENVTRLEQEGILFSNRQESIVFFNWPLQQAAGFNDPGYYIVTNFVDHNASVGSEGFNQYTATNLDYNCGNKTYDTNNGYNHSGIDIAIGPWPWDKMANNAVEIIASADGTIIGKDDGNPDMTCSGCGNGNWNAVYVRHSDNSEAWYGHMKSGSLTSKAIGETVVQGEYLGVVGSSGCSSGPHIHFEVYDHNDNLIDPFGGNCNGYNGNTSWWNDQHPYTSPYINKIMTHHSEPFQEHCHTDNNAINASNSFDPCDVLWVSFHLRDYILGSTANYTIEEPNGTIFDTGPLSFTDPNAALNHYPSAWWKFNYTLSCNPPVGTWQLKLTYNGQTVIHPFTVGTVSGCMISDISAGDQSACDPNTNTYSQDITVTYASPPAMENLVVNGQSFAVTSSPQTVTLSNLTADGQAVNVTAVFSNTTCSRTENGVFTAPSACNGGQNSCKVYLATDTPYDISESGTPTVVSTIYVPVSGTINDVNIYNLLGLHTWLNDLSFIVTSPQGTNVTIIDRQCGGDEDFNISLDDEASSGISCPYNAGNIQQPDNALSAFNGESPFGNWTLSVIDAANQDGGQLQSWTLEICGMLSTANCSSSPPGTGAILAGTYHNANISTGGTVFEPSTVVFKSGNTIHLNDNFEVQLGATFLATPEPCNEVFVENTVEDRKDNATSNTSQNLQIIPNPFSKQTTLNYQLPEPTSVSIDIYNLKGQKITQLIQSEYQERGEYQLEFDASDYTEGIYLVLFITKTGVLSKRIVLIK